MSCGFDPEDLKPSGWTAPNPTHAPQRRSRRWPRLDRSWPRPACRTPGPSRSADPDWVQSSPRRRLSYMATLGVLAAILVAVVGLVFVIVMVLNQPVGSTRADAASLFPPSGQTLSVPAASASR